jgi:hypothetical protein
VNWAEAHWHNYLKSTQARNFREQMDRLREFLARKDTFGALRYLEHAGPDRGRIASHTML